MHYLAGVLCQRTCDCTRVLAALYIPFSFGGWPSNSPYLGTSAHSKMGPPATPPPPLVTLTLHSLSSAFSLFFLSSFPYP
ncbi:hypothetical protein AMTR_s00057p00108800 [Amborella trichopoda]|uniref:Uncharacterized protein n=1 Tax=Amborella trichopoda TaxID=13333 RepID=U5D314_AMBTC|nr:hypothetical protein AMTR_s00057p00108800 [Amborella trichopoda]